MRAWAERQVIDVRKRLFVISFVQSASRKKEEGCKMHNDEGDRGFLYCFTLHYFIMKRNEAAIPEYAEF